MSWAVPGDRAVYEGWVRHRRRAPVAHAFRYRLFMLYVDVRELDVGARHLLAWGGLVQLRRADYLGDPQVSLDQAVRDRVEQVLGRRPDGPIYLLTHPRTLGTVMNPVSFYYCYSAGGERVTAIVAEITNTPWNERFSYVLGEEANLGGPVRQRFVFDKAFHVSPFMPMGLRYEWRFEAPEEQLRVFMRLDSAGADGAGLPLFDAELMLARRPVRSLARLLLRHPAMPSRVWLGIYWQALRLYLRRAPYHAHPASLEARGS